MSLRTWLRDYLELNELAEKLHEVKHSGMDSIQALAVHRSELDRLRRDINKLDELLKMPIDFRLAQARNSLMLLTSFINEIQRDLDKQNENKSL